MSKSSERIYKKNTPEYRKAYVEAQTDIGFQFQLRIMRKARGWSQAELARRSGLLQSTISRLEQPSSQLPSRKVLLKLASAFDVALIVRFLSFPDFYRLTKNKTSKALNAASYQTSAPAQGEQERER